jgi:hypothetical protein
MLPAATPSPLLTTEPAAVIAAAREVRAEETQQHATTIATSRWAPASSRQATPSGYHSYIRHRSPADRNLADPPRMIRSDQTPA